MEHFLRDLPKYKPWLSATAWTAWEEFKTHSSSITSISDSCQWELPGLVSAAITATSSNLSQDEPLTAEVTALLQKETIVPSKV